MGMKKVKNELTTKGLLGMGKPHMLGAQNDNIKKMLGLTEPIDSTSAASITQKTSFQDFV